MTSDNKIRILSLGLIFGLILSVTSLIAQPKSTLAFTIPEKDLIPEGIAHDALTGAFYISSTYQRKIVKIDAFGRIYDFIKSGQDGIWGTLGMRVDAKRGHLWVVSSHTGPGMPMRDMPAEEAGSSAVFKYDTEKGALIKKYQLGPVPQSHFLNDLVLHAKGDVFISDSRARAIYRITPEADSLALFRKLEISPNGITISDNQRYLFVALRGEVGRITIADGELILLKKPPGLTVGADGLYFYHNSLISIEPYDTVSVVNRLHLSDNYDRIEKQTVVEADHPAFNQPTTGVIVKDQLFYIANSQLQVFKRLYQESGENFLRESLQEPLILKVALD